MYKECLHTPMSILFCILNSALIFCFFKSRKNATLWSKVGETGTGKTGVGKQRIDFVSQFWPKLGDKIWTRKPGFEAFPP